MKSIHPSTQPSVAPQIFKMLKLLEINYQILERQRMKIYTEKTYPLNSYTIRERDLEKLRYYLSGQEEEDNIDVKGNVFIITGVRTRL
jgi:hypothetical protein